MRSWILKNPRAHVKSARIDEREDCFFVSYISRNDRRHADESKSLAAAKSLFSKCVLEPKHHGENVWEEVVEQN